MTPEYRLGKALISKLQASAARWTVNAEGGLSTSPENTAIVIKALQEAAMESGHMALYLCLAKCEITEPAIP